MRAKTIVTGMALAVATSCLVAMTPVTSMPTDPRAASLTDIVLVADNTGLTAKDWDLQKKAYLAMLEDEDLIPRDASVAVSLVQYVNPTGGNQGSKVTVPLTPITASSLGTLRKKLTASALLSAQHQGDEAFAAAVAEFGANGRDGADRSICGTASTPWSAAQVSTAAQSIAAAGIDRSSMIAAALQSKPTNETADLSDLSSGDGAAIDARTLIQAASMLGLSCFTPTVRLRAIEVNQVIQNWHNDVPLVEDKSTLVRVFIESLVRDGGTASGVLHGTRGGSPLPGSPLSPRNAGGSVTIDDDVANNTDRKDLNSSLNFQLPSLWLSGDIELRFEATSRLTCIGAPTGRDCAVDVSFIEPDDPHITYVRVPYVDEGEVFEPTSADTTEQMKRMLDTFPVSDIKDRYLVVSPALPWVPTLAEVNVLLDWNRDWEIGGEVVSGERWYGILEGDPDPEYAGRVLDLPGPVGSGALAGDEDIESYGGLRNTGPHEMAHAFGAHHIVNEAHNGTIEGDYGTYPAGWCNEMGRVEAPDYPYWATIDGWEMPTLGPMDTPDVEVWGIATRFLGVNDDLALISPYDTTPLMSYCGSRDSTSQPEWPDLQTYETLTKKFLDVDIDVTSSERAAPRASTLPGLWVRGTIDLTDPTTVDFADTLPFPRAQALDDERSFVVDPADLGFHINLLDPFGKVLATQTVTVPQSAGLAAGSREDDEGSLTQGLSAVFPASLAKRLGSITVSRVVTGQQPQLIGTLTRSAKAPRVKIDVDRPSAAGVKVSWVVADPDSPTVTATVLYRTNAQGDWKLVALDATSDSVVIPRDMLPGSTGAQFAVVASDGVNTAMSTSRPLTIPNLAPTLVLDGPREVILVGAQNTVVTAFARDVENGDISEQVTWRVGKTSVRGTGRTLELAADSLPEGTHTVIATAKDSGGKSTSARLTVIVTRLAD